MVPSFFGMIVDKKEYRKIKTKKELREVEKERVLKVVGYQQKLRERGDKIFEELFVPISSRCHVC